LAACQVGDKRTAAAGMEADHLSPCERQKDMQQAEQVLKHLVSRFLPEAAEGMHATYQLELSGDEGGRWHVVVGEGKCELREGAADQPDTTIAMSAEDFQALIERRLDVMQAYSNGRVQVTGNLWLAMQLGEVFGF